MIKSFLEKNKYYLQVSGLAAVVIVSWAVGNTDGYNLGYHHGYTDNNKYWQIKLIDEDFAEYDSKTGVWRLKSLEDVSISGLIIGDKKKFKELVKK